MPHKWGKTNTIKWIRAFSAEHRIVPTSSVRKKQGGPGDDDLIRLFGSVLKALEAGGAPIKDAKIGGDGSTVYSYDTANGTINSHILKRKETLARQQLRVSCSICGWGKEGNAWAAIQAQQKHRLEKHGISTESSKKKKKKRRSRGEMDRVIGPIPGSSTRRRVGTEDPASRSRM